MSALTIEQEVAAFHWAWRRGRKMGVSSTGLFAEALGLPQPYGDWSSHPHDKWDMEGAEKTYADAPEFLKPLMLPRLEWYRAIAANDFTTVARAGGGL